MRGILVGAKQCAKPKMFIFFALPFLFICARVWGHEHPPCAEPPVHDLRWEPPVPKGVMSAGINATHFGPSCPQHCNITARFFCDGIPQFSIQGPTNDDYLFLSIWAPGNPRRASHNWTDNSTGLPVLFSVARWWLETWRKF